MSEVSLQSLLELKGTPTLKALALALDIPAQRLYQTAKTPEDGMIYNSKAFNWMAIERYLAKRLSPDTIPTMEELVTKALELDAELKLKDKRRQSGPTIEMIIVDGKEIPKRRHPNFELDSQLPVVFKGDPHVYKIVFQTRSHTCLIAVASVEMEPLNDILVVRSNVMMNIKGTAPTVLEEEVAARFAIGFAQPESPIKVEVLEG